MTAKKSVKRSGTKKMSEVKSDFGMGLAYCLGLFLCHSERDDQAETPSRPSTWFNSASDHLYELQIPESITGKLRQRLKTFQEKVIHWGHGYSDPRATDEDRTWAIIEAKSLLLEVDKRFGVKTCEATRS